METQPNSSLPHPPVDPVLQPSAPPEPIESLWKTLIRCNPFYLFSALLLLYGVYRTSIDPTFLSTEERQVLFNFSSIEVYGLMLVGTVTFLARRKIWYDATLLYFIENVLLLIPFMLLSHAVVLNSGLARTLSFLGCLLAALKFGVFKAFFTGLNLPRRLLLIGALIIAVNTAIPLVFRKGLEVNNELWNLRSTYCWFLLLPLLAMAGHVLNPLRASHGEAETTDEHRKQWLPLATFLLWITGTAAHLYSVGYVDDQVFDLAKFSFLAWAVAWLLCAKITLAMSRFTPAAPVIMLAAPILTPLLALGRPEVAVALNGLNAAIYAVLCIRWDAKRIPAALGGISLLIGLMTVPNDWITPIVHSYNKTALFFALVTAAILIKALRTPTARWALIGAFVIAIALVALGERMRFSPHFGFQLACAFVLGHSLFWKGAQENGSIVLLYAAAGMLVLDSYAAVRGDTLALRLLPFITGLPLISLALVFRRSLIPIVGAGASMFIWPISSGVAALQDAPVGIVAVAASFVLFVLGTGFAIWRRRFSNYATGTKETTI